MINAQRNTARLTGVLYLLVIISAGFSQGYVRGTLVVSDDPATTLDNIASSEGLFRFGLVADLFAFLCDAVISILLFKLLKPAGKHLAMISSAFRLLAHPAIASLNLLNHYMALELAIGQGYLSSLTLDQAQILVMLFMDAHHYGYLLAGAFFGVHCLLLGILIYRSFSFPGVLGVLMILAGGGYLVETFGNFLMPGNELLLAYVVGVSAAVGEISLTVFLLIRGVYSRN